MRKLQVCHCLVKMAVMLMFFINVSMASQKDSDEELTADTEVRGLPSGAPVTISSSAPIVVKADEQLAPPNERSTTHALPSAKPTPMDALFAAKTDEEAQQIIIDNPGAFRYHLKLRKMPLLVRSDILACTATVNERICGGKVAHIVICLQGGWELEATLKEFLSFSWTCG